MKSIIEQNKNIFKLSVNIPNINSREWYFNKNVYFPVMIWILIIAWLCIKYTPYVRGAKNEIIFWKIMKFISNLEQNKIKNVEIITDEGAVYSHIIEWKCLLLCFILYNIIKFLQSAANPITKVHITNIRNLLYLCPSE